MNTQPTASNILTTEWKLVESDNGTKHAVAQGGWSMCGSVPTGYSASVFGDTVIEQDIVDGRVRMCGNCRRSIVSLATR